jgi:pyruvate ferredoxin oxidoreductase gamma subunit
VGVFQVRIHGRGGQGVVTAAEILAVAAFNEGKHAQAFPSFGSERMGAPVVAFCRMDDRPIRSREPVMEPDALIIQDPTLLHSVDVFSGLASNGYVLINSSRTLDELGMGELVRSLPLGHAHSLPATDLALTHVGRPIPNAVLLGGFSAQTQVIRLESALAAIRERFAGALSDKNCAAATAGYRELAESSKISPPIAPVPAQTTSGRGVATC